MGGRGKGSGKGQGRKGKGKGGQVHREVRPAKSRVAVVLPAPLASLRLYIYIYTYTRRRRRSDTTTIPKWVTAASRCNSAADGRPQWVPAVFSRRPLSAPGWPRPGAAVRGRRSWRIYGIFYMTWARKRRGPVRRSRRRVWGVPQLSSNIAC